MSLTQINAYVLEYVRAQKAELKAVKSRGAKQTVITNHTPLKDFAAEGIKVRIKSKA